jgi:2-iminobutanoate/2-iminopropanoate deaminase
MKKIIRTPLAPEPVGPYNQAVMTENTLYISGQIGINPLTGKMLSGQTEEQTKQIMENIGAILEAAGMHYSNLVKVSIFLTDLAHFSSVNQIYAQYFDEEAPAREIAEVKALPLNAAILISGIAIK